MLKPDTHNELNTQIQYRLIEKLTASERRYRERIENLREIVFECDREGQLTFLNQAWTETLGYPVEESTGQPLATFIDQRDLACWHKILEAQTQYQARYHSSKQNLKNRISNEQSSNKQQLENDTCLLELRFVHQFGDILWLEIAIQPGQENTLSGSLVNVTERKQAKAILQQTNEELEKRVQQRTAELSHANQALTTTLQKLRSTQGQLIQTEKMSGLGQMVAGIAHEINNPVSFVHGNLQPAREYAENILKLLNLYQQHYPEPAPQILNALNEIEIEFVQKDFPNLLNSMAMGTQRIQSIIRSLRNFSRLDEADFKAADLHEGIENTLLILNHRLKADPSHQPITIIKHYGHLPPVPCFPSQLNQVFMNLLSNAIDALRSHVSQGDKQPHPKPTITITTEAASETVSIAIADNGTGIPDDVMSKLFDPFFTTKPVGQGTGLGLSISHQIVTEKHSGALECSSTIGEGTTFVIQIPITPLAKETLIEATASKR
ncbi:MAG: ATP-binding protein [Cyanobacteria bacterium P01_D01_bin.105]